MARLDEALGYRVPNFVAAGADRRPYPGFNLIRRGSQRVNGSRQGARQQPPPTGVCRRNTAAVCEEYWNTVGSRDCQGEIGL
jgi:hypothetical protein